MVFLAFASERGWDQNRSHALVSMIIILQPFVCHVCDVWRDSWLWECRSEGSSAALSVLEKAAFSPRVTVHSQWKTPSKDLSSWKGHCSLRCFQSCGSLRWEGCQGQVTIVWLGLPQTSETLHDWLTSQSDNVTRHKNKQTSFEKNWSCQEWHWQWEQRCPEEKWCCRWNWSPKDQLLETELLMEKHWTCWNMEVSHESWKHHAWCQPLCLCSVDFIVSLSEPDHGWTGTKQT